MSISGRLDSDEDVPCEVLIPADLAFLSVLWGVRSRDWTSSREGTTTAGIATQLSPTSFRTPRVVESREPGTRTSQPMKPQLGKQVIVRFNPKNPAINDLELDAFTYTDDPPTSLGL